MQRWFVRHACLGGIHLTHLPPTPTTSLLPAAEPRTGPISDPPEPHEAIAVAGLVRFGTAPGRLDQTASGGKDLTYSYSYRHAAGGMTYRSPILHHVLLSGLQPGQQYWYRVGGRLANGSPTPESKEWSFRMPAAPPAELRIGVLGDPGEPAVGLAWCDLDWFRCQADLVACPRISQLAGQTHNTSTTLEHLAASRPDVVFILGDLSCEPPVRRAALRRAPWQRLLNGWEPP